MNRSITRSGLCLIFLFGALPATLAAPAYAPGEAGEAGAPAPLGLVPQPRAQDGAPGVSQGGAQGASQGGAQGLSQGTPQDSAKDGAQGAALGTAQGGGGSVPLAEALVPRGETEARWSPRRGSREGRGRYGHHHPEPPPGVAIAVPIAFFLFVLGIVVAALLVGLKKDRQRHETLRLMVERGAKIPVELLTGPTKKRFSDLRKGVILIATGVGAGLFLGLVATAESGHHVWALGFIPALIGLGYLLVHAMERRSIDNQDRGMGGSISTAPNGPGGDMAGPGRDREE